MDTTAEIKVSDALIEKYRHTNVEHIEWWDSTYEMFKEDMLAKGIEVDKIYFSGFYSQGDGACFEGRVCDWPVFLESLGYTENLLHRFAKDTWSFSVSHSGHYYHENCTHFSEDMPNPDGESDDWFIERFCIYNDPDDLRGKAELAVLRTFDYEAMTNQFTEMFKDSMRDLYRRLEEEYDYLTSDEAVSETIIANDLFETDEEGE
jgi:hypothetical protein